jgi:hypothetical protein
MWGLDPKRPHTSQDKPTPGGWPILAAALLPAALATLFFYPVIFQGRTFYAFDILSGFLPWIDPSSSSRVHNPLISDPINLFYPYYHYFQASLGEGVFPLWRTSIYGGMPFLPLGHPLQFLCYAFLQVCAAHDLLLWIHLAGSGVAMFLFLREIGLRVLPSLIGSVAWMFNGYVMVWFEFENVLMMAATFPLTLFFVERWIKRSSSKIFVGLVCAISLSICVNYAHLLIYQAVFVGCYCLYRYLSTGVFSRSWKSRLKSVSGLALSVLLSTLISANFLTVHFSIWEGSQRPGFSFQDLFEKLGRLPASYLTTLLFPDLFGSPLYPLCITPGMKAYANYNELCIYFGIPSLFFFLACFMNLRREYVRFFLVAALCSVAMAMGSVLYYPLATFLPGLNLSTPTRVLYVFGFSAAVLSAIGADILLRTGEGRKGRVVALMSGPLVLGGCLAFLLQTGHGMDWLIQASGWREAETLRPLLEDHVRFFSPVLLKPLLLLAVSFYLVVAALYTRAQKARNLFFVFLLLLLSYDLISFGLLYNTATPPATAYRETGAIRFLKNDQSQFRIATYGRFLHNGFSPFGIQDVGGYYSFYPERYGDYLHLAQYGPEKPPPPVYSRWTDLRSFGSPLLDLLNIKYVLTPSGYEIPSEKLRLVYRGEVNVFLNQACFPRAFLVPGYAHAGDRKGAFEALGRATAEDFTRGVILESPPCEEYKDLRDSRNRGIGEVEVLTQGPNRIEFAVSAAERGFLVVGDAFHPAWQAQVDGRHAPLLRANYIMRAVEVPAGKHRVTMVFRPKMILAGAIITGMSWTVLSGVLLWFVGAVLLKRSQSKRRAGDRLHSSRSA